MWAPTVPCRTWLCSSRCQRKAPQAARNRWERAPWPRAHRPAAACSPQQRQLRHLLVVCGGSGAPTCLETCCGLLVAAASQQCSAGQNTAVATGPTLHRYLAATLHSLRVRLSARPCVHDEPLPLSCSALKSARFHKVCPTFWSPWFENLVRRAADRPSWPPAHPLSTLMMVPREGTPCHSKAQHRAWKPPRLPHWTDTGATRLSEARRKTLLPARCMAMTTCWSWPQARARASACRCVAARHSTATVEVRLRTGGAAASAPSSPQLAQGTCHEVNSP